MAESTALSRDPAQAAAIAVCEGEDLRRPERIQTFGCLVAVDSTGRVVGASANADSMLGRPVTLHRESASVIGKAGAQALQALLAGGEAAPRSRPRPLTAGSAPADLDRRFEILAHASRGLAIVEFVPRESEPPLDLPPATEAGSDLFRHCLARAERVRAVTGYDRVMVYRFLPDLSGEVIAELRNPELPPYLGLRYPSTDIPSQARELYLENRARIIPNIYAPTAELIGEGDIDLSMTGLRAVSPYHVEYLHNMQVAATLTLSIVVNGVLWGMIACHHGSERTLSHARQEAALAEAEALAGAIAGVLRQEAADAQRALKGQWSRWTEQLGGARVAEPLLSGVNSIIAELHADGGAIFCGDACLGVGATPDFPWLTAMARGRALQGGRLVTDRLSEVEDLPPTLAVAGAMIARIDSDPPATLFVFRRAQVQEVHWGGDPRTAVVVSEADGGPSPRQSFAVWRELVRDRARSWTFMERAVFATCVERLSARMAGDPAAAAKLSDELADVAKTFSEVSNSHRLLVDALPDGVAVLLWAVGEQGARLLYANRAFTKLFGLELSDIVGQEPDHILARTRLDGSVLDFENSVEAELDVWSSALGVRRVRARREALVRYCGPAGNSEIDSLLLSDMTGASRTQDALVSAVRQAEAAERARTALLRNMSHELRTPLNAILGYSDMMAEELVGPLADGYRGAAEEIRSSAHHLLALINDTLEVARLREGKARIETAPRDLGDIVRAAMRLVSPLAEAKRITLEAILPDGPFIADVDGLALRQVMINLINNAIKFTLEDGRVDVRLGQDENGGAVLAVADTGIGIPGDQIKRLFIPFNQVDSTLRRSTGGTGLGLAIVRELIQLHGGKVEVVSREGVGSTFSVRLPAWRVGGTL